MESVISRSNCEDTAVNVHIAAAVNGVVRGVDVERTAVYCDIAYALPCCSVCVIDSYSLDTLC